MICDSVDQNRKEFFEKVGLETDEEYGVSITNFQPDAQLWTDLRYAVILMYMSYLLDSL